MRSRVVRSGDWVEYGQFARQAVALDRALAARRDELWDAQDPGNDPEPAGTPEVVKATRRRSTSRITVCTSSAGDRKLHDQGVCWFVPILYHEVPLVLPGELPSDVATAPDRSHVDAHGSFNSASPTPSAWAICDKAKTVILPVNPNLPTCLGGREESIHISEVDAVVEADWNIPELTAAVPSEMDRKIAALIMGEIEDGSCLQLGIGGMPNAVGSMIARSSLKDLGIRTEMFCDAMVELAETGHVTGTRKTTDRFKIVYTLCLGTRKAYDFPRPPRMRFLCPWTTRTTPSSSRRMTRLLAINNCVEMDLFGQVCPSRRGPARSAAPAGRWISPTAPIVRRAARPSSA